MKLEALRLLAAERGVDGARAMGKAELLDHLSPRSIVERAKEAVAHAVEVIEEKAQHLVDRVHHRPAPDGDLPAAPAQPSAVERAARPGAAARGAAIDRAADESAAPGELRRGPAGGFGVPSSTVHPHVEHQSQPQEPIGMLDFEELPETYGVDECEVLFKDPFWVFAYWEITDGGLAAARAQLGQSAASARLVLRMFTTVPTAGGVERLIHDVALPWNHGRRQLEAPRPGAHLRVAVGLLSHEGYFAPIAHSSLVRVPPAEPQPGPVEWMEVVPVKSRGRVREPMVMVRRGAEHVERGVAAPEGFVTDENIGGSSPSAARPGAPGFPLGASSSPGRRNGGR